MKILAFPFKTKSVISDEDARRLTQAFLDGDTSPEQESRLYDYYSRKSVASDLLCYREMFAWYAGLGKDENVAGRRQKRTRFIAVAASVSLLAVIAAVMFAIPHSDDNSPESLYAGSYIIRNGKKITDIEQILPELRIADHYVDSTLSAFNRPSSADPEIEVINSALRYIDDPEVKAMLMADIN